MIIYYLVMNSEILQQIDEIFKGLVKIKEFKYTYNKLYIFLNKSNFQEKIEEMENKKNTTPYTIFINKQLDNGVPLKNVLELWDKTKKNKNDLGVYIKKCKLKDN